MLLDICLFRAAIAKRSPLISGEFGHLCMSESPAWYAGEQMNNMACGPAARINCSGFFRSLVCSLLPPLCLLLEHFDLRRIAVAADRRSCYIFVFNCGCWANRLRHPQFAGAHCLR
jgi:hypothetical protein